MRSLLYRYCNLSIVLLKDENIMNPDILNIDKRALEICEPIFEKMKEISLYNTKKILESFRRNQLSFFHLQQVMDMDMMMPVEKNWKLFGQMYFKQKLL